MSRTRPPARVLRVALLHGGAVVAEHLVRPGRPVTVGTDPACTLPLPGGDGPRRHTLFRPRRRSEQHLLRLPADGLGRVRTADEGTMDLAMLALRRQAQLRDGAHEVPLHDGDRGKVVVGGGAVLFQYVAAPPVALRTLDQDFRPVFLEADDPRFLGILGAVSSVAAAFLLWVASVEPVELVSPDEMPDYIAQFTIPAPIEPPVEVEPDAPPPPDPAGVPVQRAAPEPPPAPLSEPTLSHSARLAEAARVEGRRAEVAESALFKAIGGDRDGVFSEDDDGYAAVAEHLDGLDVTAEMHGRGSVLRRRGGRDGDGDLGIGGVGTGGGGPEVAVGPVASAGPTGTARMASLELPGLDPTDPDDASLIREVVQRGAPGVQHCYTQRLKEDPTLEGRLVIQFDITVGKALGVHISTNETGDAALEECVARRVRGWRFDRSVTATLVEVPFALVPSG